MKYITLILIILLAQIHYFIQKDNQNASIIEDNAIEQNMSIKTDTCILLGFNFKILDHKSERNLQAIIQNNKIRIVSNGVQYFKYRIIYYVFSSPDNERIPTIRIYNDKIDYRILNILKYSQPRDRFLFEDIIIVDKSGIKLRNEVRSILIERTE